MDTENRLVNQKGQPVLDEQNNPIVIAEQGSDISIDAGGNIFAGTGIANSNIGKLKLVNFDSPETLEKLGDGLFYQSDTAANEQQVNNTKLRQGFLEGSNVSAVDEMTNMIATLRLFETYQKMIQSIDSMDDQSVNKIGRVG